MFLTNWGQRAETLLNELAACSEPGPGVTRLPFTPEHRAALEVLKAAMENAGLKVSLDAAGTLVGRREGPPGSKTFLMGSHQDSVREGGAYDGIMGVVLSLLALEKLCQEDEELPFAVEVLAFADEEGVRFPTALIGSRVLAGSFDPSVLDMRDGQGITLHDAMVSFGLDPVAISALCRDPDDVIGFLETHIEQGPFLEREGEAIGVVTAICGIERHQVEITGETGHAGTLPMKGRRDALVGAAEVVSEVDRLGQQTSDLRATVGALTFEPNVVNAVPRKVKLTAELRSPSDEIRCNSGLALHGFARELASQRNLTIKTQKTYSQMAQPCDRDLSRRLTQAATTVGQQGLALPSGATHDASAMADLCPITMLFVRCREGVSHKPEEYASPEDMALAVSSLSKFLRSV
ncbi:M20 family metallo-hydrolase [Ruegeria hyattellae]|uniref:M20 family metallo-hydrolase n=1 Tax=Ruegeria hyattellae TaxID=3233337 RepID=UPI00355BCBF0